MKTLYEVNGKTYSDLKEAEAAEAKFNEEVKQKAKRAEEEEKALAELDKLYMEMIKAQEKYKTAEQKFYDTYDKNDAATCHYSKKTIKDGKETENIHKSFSSMNDLFNYLLS